MKRILSIIVIISCVIMSYGKLPKPDFAYPKTVSKTAMADLKTANKEKNAELALNALIRYTIAEGDIDYTSLPASIKLAEETAEQYKDNDLHGLFDSLIGVLYYQLYSNDSWTYNQRQLPLTPLPDDLTEWSGAQLQAKIDALMMASISDANIAKLSQFNIKNYSDIVVADEMTATFYPTLADFAFVQAQQLVSQDIRKDVTDKAIAHNAGNPTAQIPWQIDIAREATNPYDALKATYEKYKGDEYSSFILDAFSQYANDMDQLRYLKAACDQYEASYPRSKTINLVKNIAKAKFRESVMIQFPSLCAKDTYVDIDLKVKNANKYKIKVYYLGDNVDDTGKKIKEAINADRPIQVLDMKAEGIVPFQQDTTVRIKFDKYGYYFIGVNPQKDSYSTQVIRCIATMPVSVYTDGHCQVITTDPLTGAPMADSKVTVTTTNRQNPATYTGTTDKQGVASLDMAEHQGDRAKVSITTGGKEYKFPSLDFYMPYNHRGDTKELAAEVLTDRSLYHPGDKLNVLAVLAEYTYDQTGKSTVELSKGKEITLRLLDANRQKVAELTSVTDEMGRATAEFDIPLSGMTGYYTINVTDEDSWSGYGQRRVMVSDYKMPDFQVMIDAVECDTPTKGAVTITGHATTYSGVPLSNATVTLTLQKSEYWWRNFSSEPIYSTEIHTDAEGKFTTEIAASVFEANPAMMYNAVVDAVSATGSTANAERSFALKEKYNITLNISNTINGEEPLRPDVKVYKADGQQTEIPLEWSLTKDTPQKGAGRTTAEPDTIASGDYYGAIDLSKVRPGRYKLTIKAKEADIANTAYSWITIYNQPQGIVPDDMQLWVMDQNLQADASGHAEILLATSADKTYLYCMRKMPDGTIKTTLHTYRYGYHTIKIDDIPSDASTSVNLVCVNGCQSYTASVSIDPAPEKPLKITGESFRDKLIPGAQETWNLQVINPDGTPITAALALDMYNKALDALLPQTFVMRFHKSAPNSYLDLNTCMRTQRAYQYLKNEKLLEVPTLGLPKWNFYNTGWGYTSTNLRGIPQSSRAGGLLLMKQAATDDSMEEAVLEERVVVDEAAMVNSASAAIYGYSAGAMADDLRASIGTTEEEKISAEGDGEAARAEAFDYRESDVPLAVWAPTLTTDTQGNVRYTFTVPNANTTWRLKAVAWAEDMNVGTLMRDFVASKPVMVMPNLPHFLRAGDTATILASVINNSDTTCTVTTTVEIFNPLTQEVISTKEYTDEIAPKLTAQVSADIFAPADMSVIGYRVKASNGTYADGEQNAIKILPSDATLIETEPFYLNPGDKEWSTVLPKEKNARLSMTFCENPAWTIVTALPGLRNQIDDYANSAAAALYSAAISRGLMKSYPKVKEAIETWKGNPTDSALVSMLEKNEDLKLAVLNTTPWVQAAQSETERMANLAMIFDDQEVDKSIDAATKVLKDLQHADGGWAWGKWCEESSEWVTGNVLAMLGDLRKAGWLPKDKDLEQMIRKALKYWDAKVEKTDMAYALVRPLYGDVTISANGQAVINATLKDIRKNWKQYTSPSYKAMAAEALYLNGDKAMAHTLMVSVSEFGVYTKGQGLRFPNVNALYSYAILLEAYGMIEPKSKQVDGLRQQLIIRKQATDWGSAVVTTEVVRSILSTGADWLVDAHGAEVTAGHTAIEPKGAIETSTGSFTADLSSHAGETLTVKTTGAGPAYGAVYAQYKRKMTEVEAHSIDDLSIEKQMYVRRGTEWEMWTPATTLEVGDRVKVQLTIHSKRNLQYVSIIDERPAAFEPVDQLPGWLWSEGVGFYRENRDATTNMHVIYMSPGTYLLTYEMNVSLAGDFSSGVATIQSQYAPEITAHSAGGVVRVKSKELRVKS